MTERQQKSIKWAQENGVGEDFLILLNLARAELVPDALSPLLNLLASGSTKELLARWSKENQAAAYLLNLSRAITRAPDILGIFPAIHLGQAQQLFQKKLEHCYLLAAIIYANPGKLAENPHQRLQLLTWLLTHAFDRGMSENLADRNLRTVAAALYNLHKSTTNWNDIFHLLTKSCNADSTFSSLNLSIESIASRLIKSERKKFSPAEVSLLKACIATANFVDARDASASTSSFFPVRHIRSETLLPLTLIRYDEFDIGTGSNYLDKIANSEPQLLESEDSDDGTIEFNVSPFASPAQHRQLGNSIHLYSAEQRQLLPWSWSVPNPLENEALNNWIEAALTEANSEASLLAALVWIAIHTGRNLTQVLHMSVREGIDSDWSISLQTGVLRRFPPQRRSGWNPKNPEEASWVRSVAPHQEIRFPQLVFESLRCFQSQAGIPSVNLLAFWQTASDKTCENLFNEIAAKHFPRLKTGMLSNVLVQQAFTEKGDEAFARLLGSTPQSGLPAPCAYGSWLVSDLPDSFRDISDGASAQLIGLGSRLDPIENLLINAIQKAGQRLIKLRNEGSCLEFHNALTAYMAIAVFSASAGRIIRDPFEASKLFDFEFGNVFIDDKGSGSLRQGRLVPLPKRIIEYLGGEYRRHLKAMQQIVLPVNPELAAEIGRLASGKHSTKLPLFFLLSEKNGELEWQSVSESAIEEVGIFECPLPLNLFRHRLAQMLRRFGLNPEIIDGLLGHAESHAATYSDHSFRVWAEDMYVARPLLERAFAELGFDLPSSWSNEPPALNISTKVAQTFVSRDFGAVAREKAKRQNRIDAYQSAENTITTFLNNRPLEKLKEDELYELSKKLLLNEKGMPTAGGHLKYEYLLLKIRHHEKVTGKRVHVRRRFFRIQEERSLFSVRAIGARSTLDSICQVLKKIGSNGPTRSHIDAGLQVALLLSVECSISDPKLLKDVALNRNIRLVGAGEQLHLQYGKFANLLDLETPVRTLLVSQNIARLLKKCSAEPLPEKVLDRAIPDHLEVLAKQLDTHKNSIAGLLESMAELMDQCNAISKPGVLAAHLAGRLVSFSPTLADMALLKTGHRVRIEKLEEESSKANPSIENYILSRQEVESDQGADIDPIALDRQLSARNFLRGVLSILRGKLPESPTRKIDGKIEQKPLARKQMAPAIRRHLKRYAQNTSSAVLLLGEWIAHFLEDDGEKQKPQTLERYLNALSTPFQQMGYGSDLLNMDEEEITDFYIAVMESLEVEAKQFVGDRLVNFHKWAQRSEFGLPAPDWSEIPELPSRDGVLPGLVSEREFQDALRLIWTTKNIDQDVRKTAAALLILGYRFGLRKKEGWGLRRKDLIESADLFVVLVRNNSDRPLKTLGSRRQVPLLFALSKLEQKILANLNAEAEAIHGEHLNVGWLADAKSNLPDVNQAATLVNIVLKQVSGSPSITLHHLRHSFANRLALAAIDGVPSWSKVLGWDKDDKARILSSLLGRTDCRRRLGWAIARMLGHMGPATTFRSYLHLLMDWANASSPIQTSAEVGIAPINLDSLPAYCPPDTSLLESKHEPQALSYLNALRLMRLLARGRNVREAIEELGLDVEKAMALVNAIEIVGHQMELSKTRMDDRTKKTSFDFMKRITGDGWQRLMKIEMEEIEINLPGNALELLGQMIGKTRQILMWENEHFSLTRQLINILGLKQEQYCVIASNAADELLIEEARTYGFSPIKLKDVLLEKMIARSPSNVPSGKVISLKSITVRKSSRRENSLQIDPAYFGSKRFAVISRCALVMHDEQGDAEIRNSIELTTSLLATCAS